MTNKSTTKIVEKSTKQTSHASSQLRCSSQTTSKLNSNTVKEVISGQIKKRSTYLTDAPKLYNSSGSVIVAEDYNSYGNKGKSDVTKSKLDSKPIINKVELENSAESKIEVFRINTDKAEKSGITSNTIQASKKVTTKNGKITSEAKSASKEEKKTQTLTKNSIVLEISGSNCSKNKGTSTKSSGKLKIGTFQVKQCAEKNQSKSPLTVVSGKTNIVIKSSLIENAVKSSYMKSSKENGNFLNEIIEIANDISKETYEVIEETTEFMKDYVRKTTNFIRKIEKKLLEDDDKKVLQENKNGDKIDKKSNGKLQEVFELADNYILSEETYKNHILARHGANSKSNNKSHFKADFDIKKGIDSTLVEDNFIVKMNTGGRSGYIFEQKYNKPIGVSSKGKSLYTLKVVIDEKGNVITAYPKK